MPTITSSPPSVTKNKVEAEIALRKRCLDLATAPNAVVSERARFILKGLSLGISQRELMFYYGRARARWQFPRTPIRKYVGDAKPDRPDLTIRDLRSEEITEAINLVAKTYSERNQLHDNWPVFVRYVPTKAELAAKKEKKRLIQEARRKALNPGPRRSKAFRDAQQKVRKS
jgi:hypothetical protein